MIEQRTEAWFAARVGKVTCSRFDDVIAVKRDGSPTAARQTYMRELAFARTSGKPKHQIEGKALTWGTEVEEFARAAFELETGLVVTPAEFILHQEHDWMGGSCDGTISTDGIIEIKSPYDEQVHVKTWLEGMPEEHRAQVQGNLLVSGRQYCEFISYDPRQCESLKLYHQRIDRDEGYCAMLMEKLLQFEAELQQMVEELMRKSA
ncbi:YqaJ viral recombinase domain-containing protein [Cupriavidus oxalaticus]|uniref:lambda exonuclease family protein n=1 Tax=Cupriavidus oxalaticus TaxID=96344 RepID=UPI003F736F7D